MRICSVCKIAKESTSFFFRDKTKGQLHSQCKACYSIGRKIYGKVHYERYKKQYIARAKTRKSVVGGDLRIKMLAYLADKQCVHCGIKDIRVLEFDHIDPNKKGFSIARGLADCISWRKLLEEIAKCRILCANCHRIRTAEQFHWYKK